MIEGTFEPQSAPWLTGKMAVEVLDPQGVAPATIIRVTDPWQVHVTWNMAGQFATILHNYVLTGMWRVRVYAESLGPNGEDEVSHRDFGIGENDPVVTVDTYSYDKKLDVQSGTLLPGIYKIVTVLTIDDNAKPTPTPLQIAAFCEGPVLQFY